MRCSLCKTGCVNDYWCVRICSRCIDEVVAREERVILWHVYYVLKKKSPFRKERRRDKKEIGLGFLYCLRADSWVGWPIFTEFATPPWEAWTNSCCFFIPICANSLSNFQMWRTGGGEEVSQKNNVESMGKKFKMCLHSSVRCFGKENLSLHVNFALCKVKQKFN